MNKQNLFKCISDFVLPFEKSKTYDENIKLSEYTEYFIPYKFTTHDGVDMFAGDPCVIVNKDDYEILDCSANHGPQFGIAFSTREAAEAWIAEQKPGHDKNIKVLIKVAEEMVESSRKMNDYANQLKEFINKAQG